MVIDTMLGRVLYTKHTTINPVKLLCILGIELMFKPKTSVCN